MTTFGQMSIWFEKSEKCKIRKNSQKLIKNNIESTINLLILLSTVRDSRFSLSYVYKSFYTILSCLSRRAHSPVALIKYWCLYALDLWLSTFYLYVYFSCDADKLLILWRKILFWQLKLYFSELSVVWYFFSNEFWLR